MRVVAISLSLSAVAALRTPSRMPSLSSQTKASLSKASLFRRTSSGLSPAIESSDSVDGKYVSSGKEKLDAICSDGRLVNEKAAEQAAREAAWIAATQCRFQIFSLDNPRSVDKSVESKSLHLKCNLKLNSHISPASNPRPSPKTPPIGLIRHLTRQN